MIIAVISTEVRATCGSVSDSGHHEHDSQFVGLFLLLLFSTHYDSLRHLSARFRDRLVSSDSDPDSVSDWQP